MADFFSTVFTQEPLGELPTPKTQDVTTPFTEGDITVEMVTKLLKQLHPEKAMGPDNMHPLVLRELRDVIAKPLQMIFNSSINTGIVPEAWKMAHVSAIFKKGDRKLPGNYRPVSLTSVVCKLLEKIVKGLITDHMQYNNLFSTAQYGFMSARSTTLQLLQVIEDWTKALDSGGKVDVLYFDFAKAFDTVPHQRLLAKVRSYGISAKVVNWIEAFVTGRKQRVTVGDAKSEWHDVTSGIPQGSVMGPTLFIVYNNDVPDVVRSLLKLFADDTKMYRQITAPIDRDILQEDTDSMDEWTDIWLMRFNPPKCKAMTVETTTQDREPQHTYTLKNSSGERTELTRVKSEKDIGVTVDCNLSFDEHINNITKKSNMLVGVIRRTYTYLDEASFSLLFKAIVRPHLEYAQAVWHPYKRKHINQIERVQRRATKLIPTLRDLTYPERLRQLGLTTLVYRRLRGDIVEVFKILAGVYDPSVTEGLLTLSHNTRTRGHSRKLAKSTCKRNLRLHTFSQRVVNPWNSLPESVVTAANLKTFEQRLDRAWRGHPLKWDPDASEHYRVPELYENG